MHKIAEAGEFIPDLASNPRNIPETVIDGLGRIGTSERIKEPTEYISMVDLEAAYRETHDRDQEAEKCGLITFQGEKIDGLTGYNTTQPVYYQPETGEPYFILGVRMETIDDELDSRIEFFKADTADSKVWGHIDQDMPNIPGQDPSIASINGQLLLNAVEVLQSQGEALTWETAFYKGASITELEPFAYGPPMMKDIRHVQMPTGEIVTFTRPQSEDPAKGGRGQIGVVTSDSIDMIKNPSILREAPLINTRFLPEEWGGINYGIALQDGKIGVIGHIARFDSDNKIYPPVSGVFDTSTNKVACIEIIAMADEFEGVTPKRPELEGVAFCTGMTDPNKDGDVMLFMGVGDAVTGYKTTRDPFTGLKL